MNNPRLGVHRMNSPRLEYTAELLRHFADLRDGSHGDAISRREKERLFTAAVALLDRYAWQPLEEINTDLLLGTGEVTATGVRCRDDGPRRDLGPLVAPAAGRQDPTGDHPRLLRRGSSSPASAGRHCRGLAAQTCSTRSRRRPELPTLRAIASADLHNLVFQPWVRHNSAALEAGHRV